MDGERVEVDREGRTGTEIEPIGQDRNRASRTGQNTVRSKNKQEHALHTLSLF